MPQHNPTYNTQRGQASHHPRPPPCRPRRPRSYLAHTYAPPHPPPPPTHPSKQLVTYRVGKQRTRGHFEVRWRRRRLSSVRHVPLQMLKRARLDGTARHRSLAVAGAPAVWATPTANSSR